HIAASRSRRFAAPAPSAHFHFPAILLSLHGNANAMHLLDQPEPGRWRRNFVWFRLCCAPMGCPPGPFAGWAVTWCARDMQQMSEKNIRSRKTIGLRVCAGGGLGNVICLVALGCAALLMPQCNALSIRDALGAIESGDDDHAIGYAGEVSRYQIKK